MSISSVLEEIRKVVSEIKEELSTIRRNVKETVEEFRPAPLVRLMRRRGIMKFIEKRRRVSKKI